MDRPTKIHLELFPAQYTQTTQTSKSTQLGYISEVKYVQISSVGTTRLFQEHKLLEIFKSKAKKRRQSVG